MLLVAAAVSMVSCNNDWEDEQYANYIGFKAPLDTEGSSVGVTTVYIPYTRLDADGNPKYGQEGLSSYQLPILVSGSSSNPSDVNVHVAKSDTLRTLNEARFSINRQELWYIDMSDYATYPETVFIPKGENMGLLDIRFNFAGIDLSDRYLLPLTVVEKPEYGYLRNPRLNFATAMLRVLPYTDYTGIYEAGNYKFYLVSDGVVDTEPGAMKNVQLYVVDENTAFFYAGAFDESSLKRKFFKVFAHFEPYNADDTHRGTVTFTCPNEDMNFSVNPEKTATYTILEQPDDVQNYILHRTIIINDIDYTFTDYISAQGSDIVYNVRGTLTMQRDLNTQMPEEDQVIF